MNRRVLFITPSLFKGGAEKQLLKVAGFIKSKQHEVMVISLKPINCFEPDLQVSGITVLLLNNWSGHFFSNCSLLYKTVRNFKPDVVVAFMFIAIIFARLLKIRFQFKLISSIRISVIHKKWYLLFKLTSVLDDVVVYNSSASKTNFQRQNLADKNGLVINNSIDVPFLKLKNTRKKRATTFVWVCIAHFKYNKDYLTLFKAIALLKKSDIRLEIIGNLHGETWPSQLIHKHQLQETIILLGQKQNPLEYLCKADAFVLSSFSEGMPNAVLEAMAFSRPVVVSDIQCNAELVESAMCGLLFEQGNEFSLAEKMLQMMAFTQQERAALGKKGRGYIEANFSEEKVLGQWQKLIESFPKSQLPD